MTTKSKPKPKAAAKTRRKKPPPEQVIEGRMIAVDQIEPSPFQPRQDFGALAIDELATTIEMYGLDSPITVRPAGDKFEIVNGERRWRAAKKLGYKVIRAEVGGHTDAQVRAIMLVTSNTAKPLNAIEEARAYRNMIDGGDSKGPTALAKLLGLSQGQVSNRLRLLELPDWWQRKIISYEIPATHAREVLRYKDHPELLAAIAKGVHGELKTLVGRSSQTVDEFADTVAYAVESATRPVDGCAWRNPKTSQWEQTVAPTKAQRKELGIVSIGNGRYKDERAANVALWDKLQAERLQAAGDGSAKAGKGKPRPAASKGKAGSNAAAAKPTLDPEMLWSWYIRWLRRLIAEALGSSSDASNRDVLVLLLQLRDELARAGRDAYWMDACKSLSIKVKRSGPDRTLDMCATLADFTEEEVVAVCAGFLAQMFYDEKVGPIANLASHNGRNEHSRVLPIAKMLNLNPESGWLYQQAGPLSEEYWSMHSKEELAALAEELNVPISLSGGKAAMVKAFLKMIPSKDASEAGLEYPNELKRIKPPK